MAREALWCKGRCQLPGLHAPPCPLACMRPPGHEGRCACEEHMRSPFSIGRESKDPDTFAALLEWCASRGGPDLAMSLRRQGLSTLAIVHGATPEQLLAAGAPPEAVAAETQRQAGVVALALRAPEPEVVKEGARFRADHPVLRPTKGGRLDLAIAAAAPGCREQTLRALREDMYAPSAKATQDSVWNTWRAIAAAWDVKPLPLTGDTVLRVVASLKAGRYRAPQQYVSRARVEHVRVARRSPSPYAKLCIRDALRSARRGIGPAEYKDSVQFEKLIPAISYSTPEGAAAMPLGRPIDPAAMVVLGTWWFARGIELSAARAYHTRVTPETVTAGWTLPVSKRDVAALGEDRVHGCCCGPAGIAPLCPFHTMKQYRELLLKVFGDDAFHPERDLPLFPDRDGNPMSKHAVRDAIASVIAKSGEPLTRPGPTGEAKQRFGEHVLRVIGAQYLAAKHVEMYRIQLYARWGSDAVQRYVQEAPLVGQCDVAAEVMLTPSLKDVALSVSELRHDTPDTKVLAQRVADRHQGDIRALQDAVELISRRLQAMEEAEALPEQGCVRNTKSGVVHRVLCANKDIPRNCWQARCPWKFGTSRDAERCEKPGKDEVRCERCFPENAATRLATAGAESEDEAWAGTAP